MSKNPVVRKRPADPAPQLPFVPSRSSIQINRNVWLTGKLIQGEVYAKVINDVCENSRQDFEEGGVELATLDLLRSEWQKKLSGLKVAQLPWDPQPAPPMKDQPVPTATKPAPQSLPSNVEVVNPPPPPTAAPSAPPIKTEANPGYPPQSIPQQNYQVPSFPQGQPMTARERAAQQLHESYGHRAGAQIAQLQSNQPRVPPAPGSPQNYIKQEDGQPPLSGVQDYRTGAAPPLKASQTDGSGDARDSWSIEYARRKEMARIHGSEADRLMRAHFLAFQQELEGGGLLMTLDERNGPSRSMLGKVRDLRAMDAQTDSPSHMPGLTRAQGDAAGDDDDDVEDEDAINSDLDDPDDLAANAEEGENTDQVMLCTYDKVQRVKNKWKCTLKDGVLRVEGNEYVFHKGQGEFEW